MLGTVALLVASVLSPGMLYGANVASDFGGSNCPACQHQITLYDGFGRGWRGNWLDVYVDDQLVLSGLSLDDGSGPVTYTFLAPTGAAITTVYGFASWYAEPYYYIYDGTGRTLCADGLDGSPTGCQVFANCEWPTGACCDMGTGECSDEVLETACTNRFAPEVMCADLAPSCFAWAPTGVLYAPADGIYSSLTMERLSWLLGGAPVDHLNAESGTPALAHLMNYRCVITWRGGAYQDGTLMGDVLADYIDLGGRVILGSGSASGSHRSLQGRIVEPRYCPVRTISGTLETGTYDGNGSDCIHHARPVEEYECRSIQLIAALQPGSITDGTMDGYPSVVWRPDRRVYYSTGNEGGFDGAGDWVELLANMYNCGSETIRGACCDTQTGACADLVELAPCLESGVLAELHHGFSCAELTPACGNPGACCISETATCTYEYEINCADRFLASLPIGAAVGQPCLTDPFAPLCGEWWPAGLLYAPAAPDNAAFRAQVSELLDGEPVDYFDARAGTPTVDQMSRYAAIMTWVNAPYADAPLMGDRLADAGRRVIMGQGCFPSGSYCLQGRIMDSCPVTAVAPAYGWYAGDGFTCFHWNVDHYACTGLMDAITGVESWVVTDGTIGGGPSVVWNGAVCYSAGNTGGTCGDGNWAELTANLVYCDDHPRGACCHADTPLDPDNPMAGAVCEDYAMMCYCGGEFFGHRWCGTLDPLCGNPGACCDDATGYCEEVLQADCQARFDSMSTCEDMQQPCGQYEPCHYRIDLYDSGGDGWGSNYLTVYVNYEPVLAQIALPAGFGPLSFTFPAATGDTIETVYHTLYGGHWEPYYIIYDDAGGLVVQDGIGAEPPEGVSVTAACSYAPGACCDDYAGVCVDGVTDPDCGGTRFAAQECAELAPGCGEVTPCWHRAALFGRGGDGWQGNRLDVYVNGRRVLDGVTLAFGAISVSYEFPAITGSQIDTIFKPDGSAPLECTFSIYNDGGDLLAGARGTTYVSGCHASANCVWPIGACCDDHSATCRDSVAGLDCNGRFQRDALCAGLYPACGLGARLLYAPSNDDSPAFRESLGVELGWPVDYYDLRIGTPTLDQLRQYDCVLTWNTYAMADYYAWGNILADFVDAGGRVILGQWSYGELGGVPPQLPSRILDPEYCPVIISGDAQSGAYAHDGTDCAHAGVGDYSCATCDHIAALQPGARRDGTFVSTGDIALAWRFDRRVYYSPGNQGMMYDACGDWVTLTAKMCTCPPPAAGDLNCDDAVNSFDIDPFVLALTDPVGYAAAFPQCARSLADVNGDGLVNAFDIDPFVICLTRDICPPRR